MNKHLAGYLFAGETIFSIGSEGSTSQENVKVEPSVKPVAELIKPIESANSLTNSIEEPPQKVYSQKNLIIIVDSLSTSEREFLSKILLSVKQTIENAEIVELSSNSDVQLSNYSNAKEIISFGIGISKLGFDLLLFPYQTQHYQSVRYLLVDDLHAIKSNQKDEKRLLWSALKSMYQI